ncbi:alpha/beta fold hydrolase [Nocardioides marmorisolisilvae]|uniref:Alpha/beta hydrolase n=1 Tax=Nocardioides marmorisolisilvae TaxID=1542737 RepID=A0A3N0DWD7_9ACTN|nr:alpha/beta hydrolase [Nocardioides marmorisolisilvae]RNL79924.1 alpha/beta hydrolase [Nocardioides marmorisolisilvae]
MSNAAAANAVTLRVVPEPDDALALRFYTVTAHDGTELQAWTNDVDGPTVLLCNGLGTNPYAWPALLDPDCGVRVISWNHRGTGGSGRPEDPSHVGIEAFVEDAIAVMDDAGIDACPVMGWSMGVNTAFELAFLHPDRVTGLFAVAGVPGGTFSSMLAPLGVPRFARAAITVNAARAMRTLGKPLSLLARNLPIGPKAVAVLSHSGFMLPVADVELTAETVREMLRTPVDWYMHLAVETSKHVRVSLRDIDVPATFVAGHWDVLASSEDMRTASERIDGAEYVELGASHFVAMEKPAEVHELLLDLLDRVP